MLTCKTRVTYTAPSAWASWHFIFFPNRVLCLVPSLPEAWLMLATKTALSSVGILLSNPFRKQRSIRLASRRQAYQGERFRSNLFTASILLMGCFSHCRTFKRKRERYNQETEKQRDLKSYRLAAAKIESTWFIQLSIAGWWLRWNFIPDVLGFICRDFSSFFL